MVTDPSKAIYRHRTFGMAFGNGCDIFIGDEGGNSYSIFGTAYALPAGVQNRYTILAGTQSFTPDEVETFYLAL